jgi:hypothetical protein
MSQYGGTTKGESRAAATAPRASPVGLQWEGQLFGVSFGTKEIFMGDAPGRTGAEAWEAPSAREMPPPATGSASD